MTIDTDTPTPAAAGGTQSLERAIALLRAVAASDPEGARLADLMAGAGLSKATTHRLLTALAREGLIEQDAGSRRYHPGPDLDALGQLAAARHRPPLPPAPAPPAAPGGAAAVSPAPTCAAR
ncbi:helix-turn-helix domain-containing protein [Azospirillum doebereinerae]|uniref:helix-turn-helix domain-containing protein n=1 Tax=Azospirillum doebereinerae TaxID=92933 RepID=UPI001EE564DF|nr:helix-turn-helix domain-containing protein [Azospirillum doebereinerae]MCG5242502.1 helix-turn-helix domain-containing protein [Azospirillum doebereinerae]